MNYIEDFGDFNIAVERFNVIFGSAIPFTSSTARKERLDIFGDMISKGDNFYKRDTFELTESSMKKMLAVTFSYNKNLENSLDKVIEREREELVAKMW